MSRFVVNVKPLSVNQVWQGKRFKTKTYKDYETEMLLMLKPLKIPDGKLSISLAFGLSSKNADIDNPVKPFIDILQKKYGFNDRSIYRLNITKVDVAKGKEYIACSIEPYLESF